MAEAPRTSGPFARLLGVEVVSQSDEGTVLALDAGPDLEREGGILHGGVLMSLLDMAMAGSVARTLEPGQTTASVSITTDFLRPATQGRLVARGVLVRRGATMAFPVGELHDASGKLVARATGVWAIRAKGAGGGRGEGTGDGAGRGTG
ncbi:MAG TPA: PaaI family thioesterase [Candidatus Thermoplasmatota archaeon]|nr:PaaI family thioesterase [Candidatus Thermoplasmatota archaeon]